MGTESLDLDLRLITVTGKGQHIRLLPIGDKTVKSLDRYLRVRLVHPYADGPWLWLGRRGAMGSTGVQQMLKRRSREAGLFPGQPAPLSPLVRSQVDELRGLRDGPFAAGWVAVAADAEPVWGQRSDGAGHRGPPATEPRGPVVSELGRYAH
jgi:hypothetical protein